MVAGTLQDQLLKAGLADSKKVKALQKEKRHQPKVAKHLRGETANEIKQAAQAAAQAKVERDRLLNAEQQALALRKAINAQIKQLIEMHKEAYSTTGEAFNFTDGKTIKRVSVSSVQRRRLVSGLLKIVKHGDQYALLPAPIADKIAQRDPDRIINCRDSHEPELTAQEKEWYAGYEIPDDLDW